jgi:hypothetical protein
MQLFTTFKYAICSWKKMSFEKSLLCPLSPSRNIRKIWYNQDSDQTPFVEKNTFTHTLILKQSDLSDFVPRRYPVPAESPQELLNSRRINFLLVFFPRRSDLK